MNTIKRIRTGSFFTPKMWVSKSHKYLEKNLGKDWQDKYYIWDCASGTGNLLEGLDNYKKVFASTLEAEEVETIKGRFKIPQNNVFQFDFLNDSFDKLPLELQDIINDPIKNRKLLIYINPPYGQPSDKSLIKSDVKKSTKKGMVETKIRNEFFDKVGVSVNQLYVQFFLRIHEYIPNCKLACFTGIKYLNSKSFIGFRNYFKAKFLDGFLVQSDTFYNVKGKFPIGFLIWDLSIKEKMTKVALDVFDKEGKRIIGHELDKLIKGTDQYINVGNDKKEYSAENKKDINQWINAFDYKNENIGLLQLDAANFQAISFIYINQKEAKRHNKELHIGRKNLIPISTYLATRHILKQTWLNDCDCFLYPKTKPLTWKDDKEFQNNCVVFALFHSQNKISSKEGTNHWIPFTEKEVGAKGKFESNFMTDFLNGKLPKDNNGLFECKNDMTPTKPLKFSKEAKEVFKAGLEIYKYYHAKDGSNINYSLHDIRQHFQGFNSKGIMNTKSKDPAYNKLYNNLKNKLEQVATKIRPKVFEYGFLES